MSDAPPVETIDLDTPCPGCGYNLRGLTWGGRCPECARRTVKPPPEPAVDRAPRLSGFDKACAVLAGLLSLVLLVGGAFGLFFGVQMSFELPPILGVLPALAGWGIARSVYVAWRSSSRRARKPVPSIYRDPVPRTAADLDAEIDRRDRAAHADDDAFDFLAPDPPPPPPDRRAH